VFVPFTENLPRTPNRVACGLRSFCLAGVYPDAQFDSSNATPSQSVDATVIHLASVRHGGLIRLLAVWAKARGSVRLETLLNVRDALPDAGVAAMPLCPYRRDGTTIGNA